MENGPDPRRRASAAPRPRPLLWGGLAAVGLAAFGLRAAHVASMLAHPLGEIVVQDSLHYHRRAAQILGLIEAGASGGVSFLNVGYPYAVAAVYALTGPSPAAVWWFQGVVGALAALALALASRALLGGTGAAVTAGAIYALYAPAVFYDGLLLTPSLTNAVLAAGLLLLAAYFTRGSPARAALAGLAFGVALLLRPNTILLVAMLAALIAALRPASAPGRSGGSRRAAAGLFLAAAAAVPSPVVLYHGLVHGQWAPISANGGMNFWVGNNRSAEGVYYQAEFLESFDAEGELDGFLAEARRRTGDPGLDLARSSTFWFREGLGEIRADPGRWLRVEVRKLALFWNRFETKTNLGVEFAREFSPVLRFLSVGFGPVAVLGLGGLVHLFVTGRRAAAWLAVSYVAASMATCVVFFVSGEYRHPAALALCVGAAAMLRALVARTRRFAGRLARSVAAPGPRERVWPALVVVVLAVPLVWTRFPMLELACHPRLDFSNYAKALGSPGPRGGAPPPARFRRALDLLDRGRARFGPDLYLLEADSWASLRGAVAHEDSAMAARALRVASELYSTDLSPGQADYPDGFVRFVRDVLPSSVRLLARQPFVDRDPVLKREAMLLGGRDYVEITDLLAGGEPARALSLATEALAVAPNHVGLQAVMGRLLLASGREEEGLDWLRRSFRGWPRIPEPAVHLAEYFASRGDRARARVAAEEALRRVPDHPPARALLQRLERD